MSGGHFCSESRFAVNDMTHGDNLSDQWDPDVSRVAQEMAGRLRALGVDVFDTDSPKDAFDERGRGSLRARGRVARRGFSWSMSRRRTAPRPSRTIPHFLLPKRAADESVGLYLKRLKQARAAVRQHPQV